MNEEEHEFCVNDQDGTWSGPAARIASGKQEIQALVQEITGWQDQKALVGYICHFLRLNLGRRQSDPLRFPCDSKHEPAAKNQVELFDPGDIWAGHTAGILASKPRITALIQRLTDIKNKSVLSELTDHVRELFIVNQGLSTILPLRLPCEQHHPRVKHTREERAGIIAIATGLAVDDPRIQAALADDH